MLDGQLTWPPSRPAAGVWPVPDLPGGQRIRGAVIATAVVIVCHHERQCRGRPCSPWAAARQWHWELGDRRVLAARSRPAASSDCGGCRPT